MPIDPQRVKELFVSALDTDQLAGYTAKAIVVQAVYFGPVCGPFLTSVW